MRKTIIVSTIHGHWNKLERLLNEKKIDYNFYENRGRLFGHITAKESYLFSLFYSCGAQGILLYSENNS